MTSPIHHLDDDILSLIFHIATDTLDVSGPYWRIFCIWGLGAISHAIGISHVCSQWRSLILHLPTIWARMMHFGSKILQNEHWIEESLRRSTGAGLRVWICLTEVTRPSPLFMTGILERLWSRTEYISIGVGMVKTDILKRLGLLIHSHAPSLVMFDWERSNQVCDIDTLRSVANATCLFGNNAPMLEYFYYVGKIFPFDKTALWLRKLRYVTICVSNPQVEPSAEEFLHILERMTDLESLKIDCFQEYMLQEPFTTISLRRISLQNLRDINIQGNWKFCTELTNSIDANSISSLAINAFRYDPESPETMDIEWFNKWFITPFHKHLLPHKTICACVRLLGSESSCNPQFSFRRGSFRLDITGEERNTNYIAASIVEVLARCNLEYVTSLIFFVDIDSVEVSHRRDDLRQLFLSLSGLTSLDTCCDHLGDIHDLLRHTQGALPSLHTVKVSDRMISFDKENSRGRVLQAFFLWRIGDGHPIEAFGLNKQQHFQCFQYREDGCYPELRGFSGLRVLIWSEDYQGSIEQTIVH